MNGAYLERLVQQHCKETGKDEATVWAELNEIYMVDFGENLECKKAEYCEDNNLGFVGLADFCEIRCAVGNMVHVFNGYIGKGTRLYE